MIAGNGKISPLCCHGCLRRVVEHETDRPRVERTIDSAVAQYWCRWWPRRCREAMEEALQAAAEASGGDLTIEQVTRLHNEQVRHC